MKKRSKKQEEQLGRARVRRHIESLPRPKRSKGKPQHFGPFLIDIETSSLEMRIMDQMLHSIAARRGERSKRIRRAQALLAGLAKTGIERGALDDLVRMALETATL